MFIFIVLHSSLLAIQTSWIKPRLDAFIDSSREIVTPEFSGDLIVTARFPHEHPNDVLPLYPESPQPAYPIVMTIDQSACGDTWRYFRVGYHNLDHLEYTIWLEPYPDEKFALHSTKYRLPNLREQTGLIEITIPAFRQGRALEHIQLSPGLTSCVLKWERLLSKDPVFTLMNWVVDESRTLTPFRLVLDKPRPYSADASP